MADHFAFKFGTFDLTPTNGIYVDHFEAKPVRRVAMAEVEGRSGGYLGRAFQGFVTITLSGTLIGSSWSDFDTKKAAFLAALSTEEPQTLQRTATDTWTAHCEALPSFPDSFEMLAAARFTCQFRAKPQ